MRAASDPHAAALEFARSVFRHDRVPCEWNRALVARAEGDPPLIA